jgi:hypothetical protein
MLATYMTADWARRAVPVVVHELAGTVCCMWALGLLSRIGTNTSTV